MNRREFLAAAAGAAAALRTGRALAAPKGRVVVVGAGLAGLSAGYELARSGWRVTVLEARKLVGGRVRTVRGPFADGQYAEAGAERFATSHETLLGYARRFGLPVETVGSSGAEVVYLDRHRRAAAKVETPYVREELERFRARVAQLRPDATLDRRSVAGLLASLRLDAVARVLAEHEIHARFAAEPEQLSLLFFAEQWALREPGALRLRGGNRRLPLAFAARLDDVRLEQAVTRISQRPGGVRVDGIDADYCILTAPLPTLTEIELSPPLPPLLVRAARHLAYGAATKTLLQYERRFWRDEGLSGTVLTDLAVGGVVEATNGQRGRAGILTGFATGRNGRLYGNVGATDRELLAADELEEIFPGSRRLLAATDSTAWTREHYSQGAFPAYAPGQVTRYRPALRHRLGRVVLAGEHTDALTGTMEGALRSGRRAAAAIVAGRR